TRRAPAHDDGERPCVRRRTLAGPRRRWDVEPGSRYEGLRAAHRSGRTRTGSNGAASGGLVVVGPRSPQCGTKTHDELLRSRGFREPVVGCPNEIAELRELLVIAGHEDEGDRAERRAELRERWRVVRLELDQYRVRLEARRGLGGVPGIRRQIARMARVLEHALQRPAQLRIVVDDVDAAHAAPRSTESTRSISC